MAVALSDPLEDVLSAQLAARLVDLGVATVGELLRYMPRRYVRRGQPSSADLPADGDWVTIVGRITQSDVIQMKSRRGSFLKVTVDEGSRVYYANFFNPKYIRHKLTVGAQVMMAGKVKIYHGNVQLSHPDWLVLPDTEAGEGKVVGSAMLTEMYASQATEDGDDGFDASVFDHDIVPIYPATKDIQTWAISAAIKKVLAAVETIPDALTDTQRSSRGLMSTDEAIRRIHMPETDADIEAAGHRLKFDEALAIQTALAQRRLAGRSEKAPRCPRVEGGLEDQLLQRLPFELTAGQREVVAEICAQLAQPTPMSRLLQGEVGSGKTLVSLLAMLRVIDNGHQCAILAPTEVLAAQHYRTMRSMLGDLAEAGTLSAAPGATSVALLTGSMRTAAKRQTLLDVVTGTAGIVIGTHALLEDNVTFFDLGLVVVDEQHRFGVEQRDVLRNKGRDGIMPHFLVMTATPIPRTVAMTVFGDLDTSVLSELPRGRQPISTSVVPSVRADWVYRAWERAGEEVEKGRQVYVVCSRIGDEEDDDPRKSGEPPRGRSVIDQYDELRAGALGHTRIALLHGRLPADEKNATMDAFGRGEIDVLVSTTVIEVGVDVPNATMMIIVDADRFGVSQLHQLRGRVGRGKHPGLCLLMTTAKQVSQAMERLRAVAASNDGFELARIDLEQRREGDVLGAMQSGGTSSLRFLSLLTDAEVIADARALADELVAADLTLADHRPLADLVDAVLVPHKVAYLDKS